MKPVLAIVFLISFTSVAFAQTNPYFHYQVGDSIVLDQFNRRDKLQIRYVQRVTGRDSVGDTIVWSLQVVTYTPKGKQNPGVDAKVKEVRGTMLVDMRTLYGVPDNFAYKWKIESKPLQIPSTLTSGQSLPDADVISTALKAPRIAVSVSGAATRNDRGAQDGYVIKSRRVSAEKIRIPTGEFDSFCVTSVVNHINETGTGYSVELTTKEWYVKGLGLVKLETYSSYGTLLSYLLLKR